MHIYNVPGGQLQSSPLRPFTPLRPGKPGHPSGPGSPGIPGKPRSPGGPGFLDPLPGKPFGPFEPMRLIDIITIIYHYYCAYQRITIIFKYLGHRDRPDLRAIQAHLDTQVFHRDPVVQLSLIQGILWAQ